jgi:hypothetical protein
MEKQDYNTNIIVAVTPKEALDGIGRVSEWWITNVDGSSHNLNDIFTIHFRDDSFVTFKIVEAIAGKKIVWLVTDCNLPWLKDKKEWKDTKVEWDISTKDNFTKINMIHFGIVPEIECYDSCVNGWDQYVKGSLFKLLTEGKGLPN